MNGCFRRIIQRIVSNKEICCEVNVMDIRLDVSLREIPVQLQQ